MVAKKVGNTEKKAKKETKTTKPKTTTKKAVKKDTKTTKTKKKTGRPKIVIDYIQAEAMASIMCTEEEIASIIGCSVRTLQRDKEFCRVYKRGLETAKMSLRRKQFALADRSASMAIFLGKNYLGQKDNIDIVDNSNINKQIIDISELLNKPKKERREEDFND